MSRTIRGSRETELESTPQLSPAEWPSQRTDTATISRHTPSSSSRLSLVVGAVRVVERTAGVGEVVGAASYGTLPAGRGVLVGGSRCGEPRSAPFRGKTVQWPRASKTVQWPRANHRHARPGCARRSVCLGSVSCTCWWLQVRPEPCWWLLEAPPALPLAPWRAVPSVFHARGTLGTLVPLTPVCPRRVSLVLRACCTSSSS